VQLAKAIVADALADGVIVDFVCGDEVYGSCTQQRDYLEEHGQAYVPRVPRARDPRASGGTHGPAWRPPRPATAC
jgi:hypothetical protein